MPPLVPVAPGDVAALRGYVSADSSHDDYLAECWATAELAVAQHVGAAVVPVDTYRRAVLEVASELYHRRNAPAGVLAQYADVAAAPVRMARDPLAPAYPLLAPFLPGGFA